MSRFRHALVTGAASGIGRAIAEALLAEGAQVAGVDRAALPDRPGFVAFPADLTDPADRERLVAFAKARPPFDLVVHAAGISATGRFEKIAVAAYERLLAVNVEAPIVLSAALMRGRRFAPRANLVFIASLSVATGYPGASVYAASKEAIAAYARSIRRPFARAGVRVTTVFPGPVRTDHAARHAPPGADASRRMPPDTVAAMILDAAAAGRATLWPGRVARLGRIAGLLAPRRVTRLMRRAILDRLEAEVYETAPGEASARDRSAR